MYINGTKVTVHGADISEKEIMAYIAKVREENPNNSVTTLEITVKPNDTVELDFDLHPTPFVRVRRITGYLSTTNRFGNGKLAELHDRVTHGSKPNPLSLENCSCTAA